MLTRATIDRVVSAALEEDAPWGDLTSEALIPADATARAELVARVDGVFSGAAVLQAELAAQGPLHERTWGERNTAAICHPTTLALPALFGRWLCMPRQPLPGDRDMPRVQGPAFGASQRMVVAPGHEADGIVQMPGGQSGHPLSPYWGVGHDDWVQGRPAPFLPGAAEHTLILRSGAP